MKGADYGSMLNSTIRNFLYRKNTGLYCRAEDCSLRLFGVLCGCPAPLNPTALGALNGADRAALEDIYIRGTPENTLRAHSENDSQLFGVITNKLHYVASSIIRIG